MLWQVNSYEVMKVEVRKDMNKSIAQVNTVTLGKLFDMRAKERWNFKRMQKGQAWETVRVINRNKSKKRIEKLCICF